MSLGAGHSVVHDQMDYRKLRAWCMLKAHSWSYGTIIYFTRNADQEKQFTLCTVIGEETRTNGAKPETKQASNVMPTPVASTNKEIQSTISNEDHGKRFSYSKVVLLNRQILMWQI